MNKLFVVGYSGHAYMVAEAALLAGNSVVGYTAPSEQENNPFDLNYFGNEGDELNENAYECEAILGIGSNSIRKRAFESLFEKGIGIHTVIHPHTNIGRSVKIGDGTFVSNSAIINLYSVIGKACIINSGAIVEHECKLGDFSHIAPGAVLAGNVKVGKECFIGANSVVKEGVKIGNNVVIGAGAVVIKDIADGSKVVGNPSRYL